MNSNNKKTHQSTLSRSLVIKEDVLTKVRGPVRNDRRRSFLLNFLLDFGLVSLRSAKEILLFTDALLGVVAREDCTQIDQDSALYFKLDGTEKHR
jgi:hypothetical protein